MFPSHGLPEEAGVECWLYDVRLIPPELVLLVRSVAAVLRGWTTAIPGERSS